MKVIMKKLLMMETFKRLKKDHTSTQMTTVMDEFTGVLLEPLHNFSSSLPPFFL